ncbi:hypothetical protein ABTC28_19615, partial [Acinetobacter baumannii]
GSFSIPTQPVATDTTGWIETQGYGACRASVSVRAPRLIQISLPSTVYVDQTLTGSFTLDSPAPPTGTVITLSGLGITNLQSDVVLPG